MPDMTPQEAQELLRQLGIAGFEAPPQEPLGATNAPGGLPAPTPVAPSPQAGKPGAFQPPPGLSPEDLNVGVAPVPPPLNGTNRIPVGPYPKEPKLPDLAPQAPIEPKLPDQVLMETYKAPMEEAAKAAQRDYDRMSSMGAGLQQAMVAARRMRGETPVEADFAGLQPFTTPFESAQIATKNQNVKNLSEANTASQKLDPNSPASKSAKLSFYASPEFEKVAMGMAASDPSLSIYDAKRMLYKSVEGMSQHSIEAFQNTMKVSGDYSRQRATEALEYASARHQKAVSSQIEMEVDNTQNFYEAMNNPGSQVSKMLIDFIEQSTGDDIPDGITGMQLYKAYPDLVKGYTELLVRRVTLQREEDRKGFLSEKYGIRQAPKSSVQKGFNANLPNYADLSENERREQLGYLQAAENINEWAPRALYLLNNPGVVNLAKQKFGTPEGRNIKTALQYVAEYAKHLDPASTKQLEIDLVGGTHATDTWLNGLKGLVQNIWANSLANTNAKVAKTFNKEITPDMKKPPATPPVDPQYPAQTYTTPEGVHGLYYKQLGPFKDVVYLLDPKTGSWKRQKAGKKE